MLMAHEAAKNANQVENSMPRVYPSGVKNKEALPGMRRDRAKR
jgi:hypothetical protein